MPWSQKQHNYFEALAHGMKSKNKNAPSKAEAARLASEGVKKNSKDKKNRRVLYGGDS